MDSKKISLIMIILLMVVGYLGTIFGISYKLNPPKEKKETTQTTAKPFLEDGKLNFYDFGTFVGTYNCDYPNNYCGWAQETIDDDKYVLNYLNDNFLDSFTLINSKYAFIADVFDTEDPDYKSSDVILYDIPSSKVLGKYKAVKNYTQGLENDYFIVKDENEKWGVIQLTSEGINTAIEFDYDYIGVQNQIANASSKLVADNFVVLDNTSWYIVDQSGEVLSDSFSTPIYIYHNNLIATKTLDEGEIKFYDYTGRSLLDGEIFIDAKMYNKYLGVIDQKNMFYLVNYNTEEQVSKSTYRVDSLESVKVETKEDGSLDIYIDDQFKENVQ